MIKRIGVVGGGQLGLMIGEAAEALGYDIVSLDPAEECSIMVFTETWLNTQTLDMIE